MTEWWRDFFDDDYIRLWGNVNSPARTEREADALIAVAAIENGTRVLDAPCGYGRIARALADRGATVVGIDQSPVQIAAAEERRGEHDVDTLAFLERDLREPLPAELVGTFDVALNIFSSVGYGTDEDDARIFTTLAAALRPGGLLFVDTMHRDVVAARMARGARPADELPDGTVIVEEPVFDPFAGRIATTWRWKGPSGTGQKTANLRIYSATELLALLEGAGFAVLRATAGISDADFAPTGPDVGGRLGLVLKRV